jgi:hypothetical protein
MGTGLSYLFSKGFGDPTTRGLDLTSRLSIRPVRWSALLAIYFAAREAF